MHRSSSSTRVSEKLFSHPSSLSTSASSPSLILRQSKSTTDLDELPSYDPQSLLGKRERNRLRFAESAVHFIPLLLIFCAIVLWFFSRPGDVVQAAASDSRGLAIQQIYQWIRYIRNKKI